MDGDNKVVIDKRIFMNYVKMFKEKDKIKKQKIVKDICKDFDYLIAEYRENENNKLRSIKEES